MQCEAHWHANGGFSGETNTKKLSYLHSSGSQFIVWMLNSMVLLALVTSVQWTPPDLPPVKHCQEAVRNKDQFFFNSFEVQHLKNAITHMSQESTVPNMARCDTTAWWTSSTLSISQRSFTALKYVLIGSPVLCCNMTRRRYTCSRKQE